MSGRENESFLRLIGLEDTGAAEAAVDQAVEATPAGEPSWSALLPGSEVHAAPAEEGEAVGDFEVAASDEDVGDEVVADEALSQPELSERTQSVTEEDLSRLDLAERTETYREGEDPSTQLARMTSSVRQTLSHAAKSLTLSQFRKAKGTRTGSTRPTVAFDYEGASDLDVEQTEASRAPESPEADGTAHFDYSKEKSDHRLVVLEGKVNALAFHLGNLPLRIGRDPTNDVVVDDVNASRFHAEIREQDGALVAVDLGSTNGLKVNGELSPQRSLMSHDVVQIGDTLFEFLEPGVLSRGKPAQNVVAQEASASDTRPDGRSRRRSLMIAAAVVIVLIAGALAFMRGADQIVETARSVAADEAQKSMLSLKSALEQNSSKPISEMSPEDVKTAALSQIESSEVAKILPAEIRASLSALPAPLIQYFVSEPGVLAEVVRAGATESALKRILRRKINDHIKARSLAAAIALIDLYLLVDPQDQNIIEARADVQTAIAALPNPQTGYTTEEQKFFEYMEQHENFVIKLVDEGRVEDAKGFSDVVLKNLNDLLAQDKAYARVAEETRTRWRERSEALQAKIDEKAIKAKAKQAKRDEADRALAEIKTLMDSGDINVARDKIEIFLRDFAGDPAVDEVLTLQTQASEMVGRSFEATKQKIETLVSTESYESAWRELYKFLEMMPTHLDAKDMKLKLDEQTRPRASQYYNQARVYEFEADDLVAAEQYYKRTMEVADPKSDLFDKAARRYAEVKRRSVH